MKRDREEVPGTKKGCYLNLLIRSTKLSPISHMLPINMKWTRPHTLPVEYDLCLAWVAIWGSHIINRTETVHCVIAHIFKLPPYLYYLTVRSWLYILRIQKHVSKSDKAGEAVISSWHVRKMKSREVRWYF